DGDGLAELAVPEDLEPALAVLPRARLDELVQVHLGEPQALQVADVDQGVLQPEGVGEPALRDAALDGHLPALEADEVHVAGAGLLALAASAGGLSRAAGLTAPDPLLFLHSTTARRRQSRQLVHRNSALRGFAPPAFCAFRCDRRPNGLNSSLVSAHSIR